MVRKEEMWPLHINEEILNKTTKCPRNFQCLTDENINMCLIEKDITGDVLFINKRKHINCPYMVRVGHAYISHICTCPTRKEIYINYNI